jgi:hypothetical protein
MQQGGRTQVRGLKRRDRCRMNAATRFAVVTLVDDAWSGSRGVDAVVTAFVLAASQPSVSAPSDDPTDPSPMRSGRARGEYEVYGCWTPETCFGVSAELLEVVRRREVDCERLLHAARGFRYWVQQTPAGPPSGGEQASGPVLSAIASAGLWWLEVDVDGLKVLVAFAFGVCGVAAFVGRGQLFVVGEGGQERGAPEVTLGASMFRARMTGGRNQVQPGGWRV